MDDVGRLIRVLGGASSEVPQQLSGLYEGFVTRADAQGARFTIPAFGVMEFGPARYVRPLHSPGALVVPAAGARLLVAFVGGEPGAPVVLGSLDGPPLGRAPWQPEI